MSGGSFDYLFTKEADEIVARSDVTENLMFMAGEIQSYGAQGEAAHLETLRLHQEALKIRAQIEQLDAELGRVREVWRMVEYKCSNDVGADSVCEALESFNASLTPA